MTLNNLLRSVGPAHGPRGERTMDVDELAAIAVDCGFKVHTSLGPGLLESAYEAVLSHSLARRGLSVERQKPIPIRYEGIILDEGFRADLLVERKLLIELKSAERLAPVHAKQLLTYMRLMNLPVGLLMNFGALTFREGVKRIANNHDDAASPRINPFPPSVR
jgi:iron complex transport system substrate-binding protein